MAIHVINHAENFSAFLCNCKGNLCIFASSYKDEYKILKTMDNRLLDNKLPYLVADMNLAAWGRKEIEVNTKCPA